MRRSIVLGITLFMFFGSGLIASVAKADQENKISVPVAFGRGLNTSGIENDAVLPNTITIRAGGVVHFLVAGLHQVAIYNPGTIPEDLVVTSTNFVNDSLNRFYLGINPAGGPLMTAPSTNPSNARNRVESVSFSAKGKYLLICNFLPHFNNGMIGYVEVQ